MVAAPGRLGERLRPPLLRLVSLHFRRRRAAKRLPRFVFLGRARGLDSATLTSARAEAPRHAADERARFGEIEGQSDRRIGGDSGADQ